MSEDFLHYIWKFKLFDLNNLTTTSGEAVDLIRAGEHNPDSGPDFFNAKVRIGETLWAGNVEIHINSSDWEKHGHHRDPAYNNVILHVVFDHDKEQKRASGDFLPVVTLKNRINADIYNKYLVFLNSKKWIPCYDHFNDVTSLTKTNWLDRLVVERLERKSEVILDTYRAVNNDWSETYYIHLARNFGFKVNAGPFELLAKTLPYAYLSKQKDNLLQVEAMLFGQAGLLDKDFEEAYPRALQKEYRFLRDKYKLKPLHDHIWKFMRLRPSNFPTIRIAQFAQVIHNTGNLFSSILENEDIAGIKKTFEVCASGYWDQHYQFDSMSGHRKKKLGHSSVDIILINTVVPFLFVYGRQRKIPVYEEKALQFLEKIEGESNAIIANWKKLNFSATTAYDSQALIELKNEYCNRKKCLNCGIGNKILTKNAG